MGGLVRLQRGQRAGSRWHGSMALYVTHTSAAAGALTWMALGLFKFGKASALGAITGMVAGLATITPAAGSVGPMGGLILGIIGGVICYFVTIYMKQRLKVDDSLDVFPVHGIGGLTGTLLAALLVSGGMGVFSGTGMPDGMTVASQFMVQLIGVASIGLYTAILTWIIVKIVSATMGLRVSADEEQVGWTSPSTTKRDIRCSGFLRRGDACVALVFSQSSRFQPFSGW